MYQTGDQRTDTNWTTMYSVRVSSNMTSFNGERGCSKTPSGEMTQHHLLEAGWNLKGIP